MRLKKLIKLFCLDHNKVYIFDEENNFYILREAEKGGLPDFLLKRKVKSIITNLEEGCIEVHVYQEDEKV